jgi:metallophosphoesterase (TIGR00282 family)
MKLLFIGDIFGNAGRKKICDDLPGILNQEGIDFTIAQGENIAGGKGITKVTVDELFKAGVDCVTAGNHTWKQKEIFILLENEPRLLRPANYPEGVAGKGYAVYEKKGVKIGVVNLEGRTFMRSLDNPFRVGKKICEAMIKETPNVFIDFHAEATSEKRALGLYLNPFATAIIGTHTHVPTADEQVIGQKTAYITDVGMVGSRDSIIGDEPDDVISHFLLQVPHHFKPAKENICANSVIVDFNENTGTARSIIRLNF